MKCPRCGIPLSKGRIDAAGVAVEAANCTECTGHWISLSELKEVEQVVDVHLLKWRHLPGMETQGRILFCPRCPGQKPMDKVVSDRDRRVVMDECPACNGVWLDYGELEAIQSKGLLGSLADILTFIRKA
jgi:Zn-finger nucleic acid-binding protein